jgi:IS1 family transposase
MSGSLFPPKTREVQFDEKWNFVGKKEKQVIPGEPKNEYLGDNWDHVALDAEHRLVLSVVPGKRTAANCDRLVEEVKQRTQGRTDILLTSDEHEPYSGAISKAYGEAAPVPKPTGPDRLSKPKTVMPEKLCYATVRKTRKGGRVREVVRVLVYGIQAILSAYLERSTASTTINTAFIERNNGTDRGQNSRKARKTYCFSKNWELHNAATYFMAYSYNFCWPVRTLSVKDTNGTHQKRTPAMSAGLADHVWTLREWITYPARGG